VKLSRRDFLKLSGATAGGVAALSTFSGTAVAAEASDKQYRLHKRIGETSTICCYCGVGCGAIVAGDGGELLNLEGDPDHPINEGSLCSKGQAMAQIHQVDGAINPYRLTKPLYREARGTTWQELSWSEAIDMIARRIKAKRDATFITTDPDTGRIVNRTDAIGNLGGGELDNEECYLLVKMARALGIVFLEHCARI
jgi:formate dehydrogenase major subunit